MEAVLILVQCRLFAGLGREALERLAQLCATLELAGGDPLFNLGDPAEYLYIVVTGRLRALRGSGTVAGDIGRFELIGEISILTGEPRSGAVYALRDSVLLRIHRERFLEFITLHPSALLEITRTLIGRMRQNQQPAALAAVRATQNLVLLPADPTGDIRAFAARLAEALATPVVLITAADVDAALGSGTSQTAFDHSPANRRLVNWLGEREASGHRLLYCASGAQDAWTERCLRQADRILLVASDRLNPNDSAAPALLRRLQSRVPVELILQQRSVGVSGPLALWRGSCTLAAHHYLAGEVAADYARLARQLNGESLGLVLGGGGARGFAHIGLIRALEELSLPIDIVGGSSMGAFFSALLARGADSRELRRIARDTFVEHNYLNDFVLPRVSLIRGRRFLAQLKAIFGDDQIEALRTPFFCVSTNLTRGITVVHEHGPLATWVATSMAVPGIAPPMVWQSELLVDGALINSLPIDVMRNYARGPIIASDVSTAGSLNVPGIDGPDPEALLKRKRSGANVTLTDILFRSAMLTSEAEVRDRGALADLYLRMPVSGIGLFDWKRIDDAIERGYRHALQGLAEFRTG